MDDIQISLVASATRPVLQNGFKNWERFVKSLEGNKINYEVIFVGHVECPYPLPKNFRWIKANVKPSQCYAIGFWAAKGELVGWTADDADYTYQGNVDNLDRVYNAYKKSEEEFGDKKTVIAMRPVEGGNPDVQEKWHYLFGGSPWSPQMAPFGIINREYFVYHLKGYDREYISGQSENGAVMRVFEDGGRVIFQRDAWVQVHHNQVHPRGADGKEDNKFRKFYNEDRKVLEKAWIVEGYGSYEKLTSEQLREHVTVSKTRLVPFVPFEQTDDVCEVSQGQKGNNAPWN